MAMIVRRGTVDSIHLCGDGEILGEELNPPVRRAKCISFLHSARSSSGRGLFEWATPSNTSGFAPVQNHLEKESRREFFLKSV